MKTIQLVKRTYHEDHSSAELRGKTFWHVTVNGESVYASFDPLDARLSYESYIQRNTVSEEVIETKEI